jgi:hypothetical protein
VDIVASNINLGGYQLNLGFDPLAASLDSITFDQALGAPFSFTLSSQAIDSVEMDEVSFADEATLLALQGDAAAGNQFSLIHLTFTATQAGTANFTFNPAVLTDPAGNPIDAALRGLSVNISTGMPTRTGARDLGVVGGVPGGDCDCEAAALIATRPSVSRLKVILPGPIGEIAMASRVISANTNQGPRRAQRVIFEQSPCKHETKCNCPSTLRFRRYSGRCGNLTIL